MNEKEITQAILLMGGKVDSRPGLFPTLSDMGWEFTTSTPRTVPVVSVDGHAFVGTPDEDGIMWTAGRALVVAGGDEREARRASISYVPDCKVGSVTTRNFRVVRGFGQTPVLTAV